MSFIVMKFNSRHCVVLIATFIASCWYNCSVILLTHHIILHYIVLLTILLLQVYIQLHWPFIVVELQIQSVNISIWMNVMLAKLWIFSLLNLATVTSTILILALDHLSVLGMTVLYQPMNQSHYVTDIVPVASDKIFSSTHKARLCVILVEMETSSESDLHASLVSVPSMFTYSVSVHTDVDL